MTDDARRALAMVSEYSTRNAAFQVRHLHAFRVDVGFGAEFVRLLYTAASCWQHQRQLCVMRPQRVSAWMLHAGWHDYFELIFPEQALGFAGRWNTSEPSRWRRGVIRHAINSFVRHRADAFSTAADVRPSINENFRFLVTHEGVGYWDSMQHLSEVLWTFNSHTRASVDGARHALFAGDAACGVHIRRGDKKSEYDYMPLESYCQSIRQVVQSSAEVVLIASDDRRAAQELSLLIAPFCKPIVLSDGDGYHQATFNREQNSSSRKQHMIRLFAEIELLRRCKNFVGTSTSNIFLLVGSLRAGKRCIDLTDSGWLPIKSMP